MKKILFSLVSIGLMAAGCNNSIQTTNTQPSSSQQQDTATKSPLKSNIIHTGSVGGSYLVSTPNTTYENDKLKFTINIPVGFKYQDATSQSGFVIGGDVLQIWDPTNDNNSVVVNAYEEPEQTNGKMYTNPSDFLKDNPYAPDGSKELSLVSTTMDGYPEVIQTMSTSNGEGRVRAVLKGKAIYVILDSPSTDRKFENIAESFKFIK